MYIYHFEYLTQAPLVNFLKVFTCSKIYSLIVWFDKLYNLPAETFLESIRLLNPNSCFFSLVLLQSRVRRHRHAAVRHSSARRRTTCSASPVLGARSFGSAEHLDSLPSYGDSERRGRGDCRVVRTASAWSENIRLPDVREWQKDGRSVEQQASQSNHTAQRKSVNTAIEN